MSTLPYPSDQSVPFRPSDRQRFFTRVMGSRLTGLGLKDPGDLGDPRVVAPQDWEVVNRPTGPQAQAGPGATALDGKLTITPAGKDSHQLSLKSLNSFDLELWPEGFFGRVVCTLADYIPPSDGSGSAADMPRDLLHPDIYSNALMEVQLDLEIHWNQKDKNQTDLEDYRHQNLCLKGLLTKRSVEEHASTDSTEPGHIRRVYSLEFADAAYVLLRNSFPTALQSSIRRESNEAPPPISILKAIRKQLPTTHIDVLSDWEEMTKTRDHVFFGLQPQHQASLLSYMRWVARSFNGALLYDYREQAKATYRLVEKKPNASFETELPREWFDASQVRCPEEPRFDVGLVNTSAFLDPSKRYPNDETGYTEVARSPALDPEVSLTPLRHDQVVATPIGAELDALAQHAAHRYPDTQATYALRAVNPLVVLPGDNLKTTEDPRWFEALQIGKKEHRCTRVRWSGINSIGVSTQNPQPTEKEDPTSFRCDQELEMEAPSSVYFPLFTDYVQPHYPMEAEAIVEALEPESSDPKQKQKFLTEDKPVTTVICRIPAFNATVKVPVRPIAEPGMVLNPRKGYKILLELDHLECRMIRYVEHRPSTSGLVKNDNQAAAIALGLDPQKDGFSIVHGYEDGVPTTVLERRNDCDTGNSSVQLQLTEDGFLVVHQDDRSKDKTRICTLDLNREDGILIEVQDRKTNASQRIQLDGEKLACEVSHGESTSTFEQTPTTIKIAAAEVLIESDTTQMISTAQTVIEAGGDFTTKADASSVHSAAAEYSIKSDAQAALEALEIAIKSTAATSLEAVKFDLTATDIGIVAASSFETSAATWSVKGAMTATIDAAVSTIKNLVKFG